MKSILTLLALGLLSNACQTVESISISQVPAEKLRKTEIHSEASSPIVLLIPFGSGYIDEAQKDLVSQCAPPGKIEGTISKHTSTNYFLLLFMSQKASMSGYCVAANDPSLKMKAKNRDKDKANIPEAKIKAKGKPKKMKKGE